MPLTLEELLKKIDSDETRYWLKDAVMAMSERDPGDAFHDAEMLLAVCKAGLYQVEQNNKNKGASE